MKSTLALARDVVIEARRSQFFHLSLALSILLLFVFTGMSALDEGLRSRLFIEAGMSLLWFIHFCLAVLFAVEVLYKDVESKSIYFLLVRDISRTHYLLGKFCGLSLSLWISILISGTVFVLCAIPLIGFEPRLLAGMLFLMFEVTLISALMVLLCTVFSKLLSLFIFIFLFFFASFLEFVIVDTDLLLALKGILFLLPNFRYYTWIEMVVHAKQVSMMYVTFLGGYTAFMSAFYLVMAGFQFDRKEL